MTDLPTLATLHVQETDPTTRVDIPPSVRSLCLQGPLMHLLDDLPRELTQLQLVDGNGAMLEQLPTALRSLAVVNNEGPIEVERLPRLLQELTLDGEGGVDASELPPNIEKIRLLGRHSLVNGSLLPWAVSHLTLKYGGSISEVLSSKAQLHSLSFDFRYAVDAPQDFRSSNHLTELELFYPPPAGLLLPPRLETLAIMIPQDGRQKNLVIEAPESLTTLRLKAARIEADHVEELASGLQELHLNSMHLLGGFPDLSGTSIVHLDLTGTDLSEIDGLGALLPHELQRLVLAETGLRELPSLPKTVQVLEIQHTWISDLAPLSNLESLYDLTLHRGQVERLEGAGDELRRLRFLEPLDL